MQNNIRQKKINAINCQKVQFNREESHFNDSICKLGIEDLFFPEIKEFSDLQPSLKAQVVFLRS